MTMPRLCNLSFKRFRSLSSAVLELDNPTFLVGQNGAGKSNIVDAFSFLYQAMTFPLTFVFDSRGGIATVENRGAPSGRPSNLGLRVELENLDGETSRATYAFALRGRGSYGFEVVREQCSVMRRDGSHNWFDRSRDAFRCNADSLQPALETNALALPLVGGDTRFFSVFRFLTMMRVYRIEPARLREMQNPSIGMQLHSDGRNAANVWREIGARSPDDTEIIRELIKKIVPGAIDIRPKMHGDKWTLELIQKGADATEVAFEARNMSDGTLRAVGILAAVFQHSSPSVLVIEEPEATLHPGALGAILDLLRHAGRSIQTVVTTHSPDVLDASWIEDRHLRIVNWKAGATRIAPVSEASRIALRGHLMGAGELLRSNALMAADFSASDPPEIALFEEGLG